MISKKPSIYLTSPVFREIANNEKVCPTIKQDILAAWERLHSVANVIVSKTRFPEADEITQIVQKNHVDFIGCHLSHAITEKTLQNSSVSAVCTSTAGFNHIRLTPGVLITHTPSVLDKTVSDFTIAIILANLRNIIGLHNFLWDGSWSADQKWDLDENLNNTMDNLTLGFVGMGEIGREVVRRLAPWGIKMIYFDLVQQTALESEFSNLSFIPNMEEIFEQADIVSLHIPLNNKTKAIVSEDLLKRMKPHALLVNTARGPIIDFPVLLRLLKSKEISINLAFDVYDPEPISEEVLNEFRLIKQERPELRFAFIPHNASADADTRGRMAIILLNDLIRLAESREPKDLADLHLIPAQHKFKNATDPNIDELKDFRIYKWWNARNN